MEQKTKIMVDSAVDWFDLIFDVQTDPGGPLSSSKVEEFYRAIYPHLMACAIHWIKRHSIENIQPEDLVAIGIEFVFNNISKFEVPHRPVGEIGAAFKSWVTKCCKREWAREAFPRKKPHIEYSDPANVAESVDSLYDEEDELQRYFSNDDRQKMKLKMNAELAKLPPSMQSAILETVDSKDMSKLHSRIEASVTKEIAEKYGYSPGAVRTACSRLKKKLLTAEE